MNLLGWSLRAALVASVVGNVYLIATGPGTRRIEEPVSDPPARTTRAVRPAAVRTTPASPCDRALRVAARELSDTERRLGLKLRPAERFARGQPDPASKARLEAFMDDVFGTGLAYTVAECRGRVCKLEVTGESREWMVPLQSEGFERGLFDGASFGAEVFLVIMEEPRQRGWQLAMEVDGRLRRSTKMAQCKLSAPPTGDLHLRLDLDADDRFTSDYSGSLAGTPFDACMRAAVAAELSTVAIPAATYWPPSFRERQLYP